MNDILLANEPLHPASTMSCAAALPRHPDSSSLQAPPADEKTVIGGTLGVVPTAARPPAKNEPVAQSSD
ncbi:hypothetical protein [Bradyrhizobium ottawaense]|uniref:hypothetical protein n=1 Tax=Bradyrhizobium ottawaense TaxID=931866 RepID=UPI0015CF49F8|nr:hypothetical protein [Bradyrhizobium ottawaense]